MNKVLLSVMTIGSLALVTPALVSGCHKDDVKDDVKIDVLMEDSRGVSVGAEVIDSAITTDPFVAEVIEIIEESITESQIVQSEEVVEDASTVEETSVAVEEPVVYEQPVIESASETQIVDTQAQNPAEVVDEEAAQEPVVAAEESEQPVVFNNCQPDVAAYMNYIHSNNLLGENLGKTTSLAGPAGCTDALVNLGNVSNDMVAVRAFWVVEGCRNEYYYNYNLANKTLISEKSRSQCEYQEWSEWQNY